jgi:hypothetical protein
MSLYRLPSVQAESVYRDPREILPRRRTRNMLPRSRFVNVLLLCSMELCSERTCGVL